MRRAARHVQTAGPGTSDSSRPADGIGRAEPGVVHWPHEALLGPQDQPSQVREGRAGKLAPLIRKVAFGKRLNLFHLAQNLGVEQAVVRFGPDGRVDGVAAQPAFQHESGSPQ